MLIGKPASRPTVVMVTQRMDTEQPDVEPLPPPLPPMWPPPPAPPAKPETAISHQVAAWLLGVAILGTIAGAAILVLVLVHPVVGRFQPPSRHAETSAPPSPTSVPPGIEDVAKQYLAAVAPVNADRDRFHAALQADAALPCSCPPGQFQVREDSLAQIPAFNRDMQAFQAALQMIKSEVPSIGADVDAVVSDNQQYMNDLAAAYHAGQQGGTTGVGEYIDQAAAADSAARLDFVRIRADLGLPPPSNG